MTSGRLVEAIEQAVQRAREMDAPLSERLQTVADKARELSPPFADAVDRLVARLIASDAGTAAPKPGEPMPPFVLPDESGRLVGLDELLKMGPVAVAFHRGHWCPYCRLNVAALAEVQKEAGTGQVVAITPDRRKFAAGLKAEAEAPFPVLTDMDNGYAMSLNLAVWLGEEMSAMIEAAGCDLPEYQGNDSWMLPIPATFVVGTDGIIKARYVDPDYRRRMAIEDLVGALKEAG